MDFVRSRLTVQAQADCQTRFAIPASRLIEYRPLRFEMGAANVALLAIGKIGNMTSIVGAIGKAAMQDSIVKDQAATSA